MTLIGTDRKERSCDLDRYRNGTDIQSCFVQSLELTSRFTPRHSGTILAGPLIIYIANINQDDRLRS